MKISHYRNILRLIVGNGLAQVVMLVFVPILALKYTPEDFGHLALFSSIGSLGSVLISGRMEIALLVPKSFYESIFILFLGLAFTFILSGAFFATVIVSSFFDIYNNILFLCVPSIFLYGIYNLLSTWNSRKRSYSNISLGKLVKSFVIILVSYLLAEIASHGLIYGAIVGQLAEVIILLRVFDLKHFILLLRKSTYTILKDLLRKYSKFPLHSLQASFFSKLSLEIPVFLIDKLWGSHVLGLYNIGYRIVSPLFLLTTSIGEVFRREVTSNEFKKKGYLELFLKISAVLAFFSGSAIFLFSYFLFGYFFEDQWKNASYIAISLIPFICSNLIASPISNALHLFNKQDISLKIQVFFFVLSTFSFIFPYFFNVENIIIPVFLFSLSASLKYFIELKYSYEILAAR